MPVAAIENTNSIRDAVETAMCGLLREGDADLVRDCRRAFEAAALDYDSEWSAWSDAWIEQAYEQAGARLDAHELSTFADWCTCGHAYADHFYTCSKGDCDCKKFARSRKTKRPTPRCSHNGPSPVDANRQALVAMENAEFRRLFGDMTEVR